jgi:hypothetical protein
MARNGKAHPPGWKTMRLSDLLPEAAIADLTPVMNRLRDGILDQIEGRESILKILNGYREELLAKEVLPEYLSYVLVSLAMSGPGGELGGATV